MNRARDIARARSGLAEVMSHDFERLLNREGIARKVFKVEKVKKNELPNKTSKFEFMLQQEQNNGQ